MPFNRWHGVSVLAFTSTVTFVLAAALIAALMFDPVSVAVAIQRGSTAELVQALVDALATVARALLRWL